MAADALEAREIRAAALGVLVSRRPALSDGGFQFLLTLLQPDTDADLRQTASQILRRAKLNEDQLLLLARPGQAHTRILLVTIALAGISFWIARHSYPT